MPCGTGLWLQLISTLARLAHGPCPDREAACAGVGPADGPNASGWGPLRVWPGGLCLSRSLGDFDVGTCVLALPHIFQARAHALGLALPAVILVY